MPNSFDPVFMRQQLIEIEGVLLDDLLSSSQKIVFIESIIKGVLANPPGEEDE